MAHQRRLLPRTHPHQSRSRARLLRLLRPVAVAANQSQSPRTFTPSRCALLILLAFLAFQPTSLADSRMTIDSASSFCTTTAWITAIAARYRSLIPRSVDTAFARRLGRQGGEGRVVLHGFAAGRGRSGGRRAAGFSREVVVQRCLAYCCR